MASWVAYRFPLVKAPGTCGAFPLTLWRADCYVTLYFFPGRIMYFFPGTFMEDAA
jgi:hypothetical protein